MLRHCALALAACAVGGAHVRVATAKPSAFCAFLLAFATVIDGLTVTNCLAACRRLHPRADFAIFAASFRPDVASFALASISSAS